MTERVKTYSMFWRADCGDNTWDEHGNCKLCGGSIQEINNMSGEYVKKSDYIKLLDLLQRFQRIEMAREMGDHHE